MRPPLRVQPIIMQLNSLLNQAVQDLNSGNLDNAEAQLKRAQLLAPKNIDVLNLLGVLAFNKGRLQESLQYLEKVVQGAPDNLMACYNLGNILMRMGDHRRALEFHERALRIKPDDYWILMNRGVSLSQLRCHVEAAESLRRAIALNPQQADAWQNLATCLKDQKKFEEALVAYDEALQRRPDYTEAWSGKGSVLHSLTRYEDALACFDRALQCDPRNAEAWSNKGATLGDLTRYAESLACFDRAIDCDPAYRESYWNKSLIQLLLGDFEEGWRNYRSRWQIRHAASYRHGDLPRLEALDQARGKTVLVWAEQGLGDSLQFARYLPLLVQQGCRVVFEVQAALSPLFAHLSGVTIVPQGRLCGHADAQVALLDLPCLFQTRLDTIPATVPYVHATPESMVRWRAALGLSSEKLNIGIACSGNAAQDNDHHRSMPLQALASLFGRANCYLLQKDLRDTDRSCLESHPEVRYLGDQLSSFEDTAAIVANLDLVISVDTSLAHLAGAMGRPLFALIRWAPDWRYMLERKDNPWYPSARVFRQASLGDWASAVNAMLVEFDALGAPGGEASRTH